MSLLRKKPDDRAAAQKTAQFPKNAGSNTPPRPPTEAEVARLLSARTSVVMGSITAAVLVFGFGLWSVLTEISGAIVASGQLEVSQNRQVVQHPDGGVVAEIAVKEAQTVKAGDLLFTLEQPPFAAEVALRQAQVERAEAELRNASLQVSRGRDRLDFERQSDDGTNGGWLLNINRLDPEPETGWPAPKSWARRGSIRRARSRR